MQFKFEFALWTRKIIPEVIYRQFKISLSVTSVWRLLSQFGITAQKPFYKAYEQHSGLVEEWKRKEYPQIQGQAIREKATIYFADEAGIRSDYHYGKTWGKKWETPILLRLVYLTDLFFSLWSWKIISMRCFQWSAYSSQGWGFEGCIGIERNKTEIHH